MVSKILRPFARLADRLLRAPNLTRRASQLAPRPGRSGITSSDYEGCPEMGYDRRGPGGYHTGEMVWTWVAFEEDANQGKDRPVLLVGSDEGWLLGLPATSKDHDRDAAQERRAGRYWVDIGSGKWDAMGRPSEVRADRIIRVHPDKVRRAAGRVDSRTFDQVADAVARHWDD